MAAVIDYLAIGHITRDLIPDGNYTLGGTVCYAAKTSQVLGMKAGILTSINSDSDLSELEDIAIAIKQSPGSTVFENLYTPQGRIQYIHSLAEKLTDEDIPRDWRTTPIVHLGPIANELDIKILSAFDKSFIGLTPQGWLRQWDDKGLVYFSEWQDAKNILPKVDAVVLSIEDVKGNWDLIDEWAAFTRMLAVTMGEQGAAIYFKGERIRIAAPRVKEVDQTGAGDVFATAFFMQLFYSRDPIAAGKFAVAIASSSIEDFGLKGIKYKDQVPSKSK